MNCKWTFSACQRNIHGVAEDIYRSIIGEIRLGENACQIGAAEIHDERIVLNVIRIIDREKTERESAVIERNVRQEQTQHYQRVQPQSRASSDRCVGRGTRNKDGCFKRFGLHGSGQIPCSCIPAAATRPQADLSASWQKESPGVSVFGMNAHSPNMNRDTGSIVGGVAKQMVIRSG